MSSFGCQNNSLKSWIESTHCTPSKLRLSKFGSMLNTLQYFFVKLCKPALELLTYYLTLAMSSSRFCLLKLLCVITVTTKEGFICSSWGSGQGFSAEYINICRVHDPDPDILLEPDSFYEARIRFFYRVGSGLTPRRVLSCLYGCIPTKVCRDIGNLYSLQVATTQGTYNIR